MSDPKKTQAKFPERVREQITKKGREENKQRKIYKMNKSSKIEGVNSRREKLTYTCAHRRSCCSAMKRNGVPRDRNDSANWAGEIWREPKKRGKTKAPANPGYGGFLLSCSRILRGTANRVTRHTPGLHALSPGPLSPSSCVLVS
jgi:hypothetical protein